MCARALTHTEERKVKKSCLDGPVGAALVFWRKQLTLFTLGAAVGSPGDAPAGKGLWS